MKTIQEKLNINNESQKNKYYVAFSYLNVRPLFKSQLLEYFDFDIERAWNSDEKDLAMLSEHLEISIPRSFLSQKEKLDID